MTTARLAARPAGVVATGRVSGGVVLLALFAWLAASAGLRPLMLPDEGRYVGVAWAMLSSGDWLTPQLDGLPFFHKPPLFYWLSAAGMAAFGPHAWAARLPSLLGATLGGISLFLFLRRWSSATAALRTLAVLAVQPLFLVGAQFANLDMLVAGCITATVLCGAHALLGADAGRPHRGAVLGTWMLAAAGVLAKGLIGIVIPGAVLLAWIVVLRRWRWLLVLLWWPAPLAAAALAAPWFLAMEQLHPGFLHYFFVVQHFQRYAAGGFNNVQPFWFYPAVLALCSLPWLPALRRAEAPVPALRTLMLVWAGVVVVFFSLPASKLVGYVLPAVPPLAALFADGVARWGRRGLGMAAAVSLLAGLGLVVGLAVRPPHSGRELAQALVAQRAPGEPVVALMPYPYDLPFYARLKEPVVVVQPWSTPAVRERDDWRRELADAGDFAPERAARTLLEPAALPAWLCGTPVAWLLTTPGAAPAPWQAGARAVYSGRDATLWRWSAAGAPCPAAGNSTRTSRP